MDFFRSDNCISDVISRIIKPCLFFVMQGCVLPMAGNFNFKKCCLQKAVNWAPIKNCNAFYVNKRDNNKQNITLNEIKQIKISLRNFCVGAAEATD